MSNSFDKLIEIGANKIHEQTHMSLYSINSILNKSFEQIDRVQFNGFVSLLEKTYQIDLSELKEEYEEYDANKPKRNKELELHTPNPTKFNFNGIVKIVVVAIIIAILVFVYQNRTKKSPELSMQVVEIIEDNKSENSNEFTIQDSVVEEKQSDENATFAVEAEDNSTKEENVDVENSKAKIAKEKATEAESLTIIPKSKVWIGVINRKTGKKKETLTSNKYVVDISDNTLMVFGHGNVEIVVGDETIKPNRQKDSRFSVIDAEVKQISAKEFKKLNRGKLW
ncbi:MAG: hypothetical protein U9N42_07915 [Campylobacterota bacterium]|nr:hypothetical protein [Campylobacterota bacterium]